MRKAKSYSIVDHQLLHGRYFHQLSHQALALYLFLVVVGDREGKSFYGNGTIQSILRFSDAQLKAATDRLIASKLIEYRRPYWWVTSLQPRDPAPQLEKRQAPADSTPGSHAASGDLHPLNEMLLNFLSGKEQT